MSITIRPVKTSYSASKTVDAAVPHAPTPTPMDELPLRPRAKQRTNPMEGGELELPLRPRARDRDRKEVEPKEVSRVMVGGFRRIENPAEGMLITDLRERERAWRELAKRKWAEQPAFLDRGKKRFEGKVLYDPDRKVITWNGKPIEGSYCWNATYTHPSLRERETVGPRLGQIILTVMVKNESRIIERMLASLIDDIDGFIVLDTGSTDRTPEIMWEYLVTKHKKSGAIFVSPWFDFGVNRTIVAQLSHLTGDWLFLSDGDYILERKDKANPQSWKKHLPPIEQAPAWYLLETTGLLAYSRPHLVQGQVRWQYSCRTHEYLGRSPHDRSTVSFGQPSFPHLLIDHVADGGSKADKFYRDVHLLMMDMLDDPRSERPYFYCSNTFKQMGMYAAALKGYKMHAARCGWLEELYCAAMAAMECVWSMPNQSFERALGWCLHGITQNPERLELLSRFLKKLRTTKEWWPRYSHLASCLAAFFTHNVYPETQKLFIERPEHEFGFWNEMAIAAFYSPQYLSLGLYASKKVLELPTFKDQHEAVRRQSVVNRGLFEQRLNDWVQRGCRSNPAIRKYLLEQGHKAFAQDKWAKAIQWYNAVLHPIVLKDLIPASLHPEPKAGENMAELCQTLSSVTYHKFNRLTAWQNARVLTPHVSEADMDKALACFQMGQAQARLSPDDRVVIAVHYVDALKWAPAYSPAVAALYELTIHKPSDITRCITYLMRLVTIGPAAVSALPVMHKLREAFQAVNNDQSEMGTCTAQPKLAGTPWIVPKPKPWITRFQIPTPRCSTVAYEPWMNLLVPRYHHYVC
jgi:hypothetical protein